MVYQLILLSSWYGIYVYSSFSVFAELEFILLGSMVCRYSGDVATCLLLFVAVLLCVKGGEGSEKPIKNSIKSPLHLTAPSRE